MKYNPWLPDLGVHSRFYGEFTSIFDRFLSGTLQKEELSEWKQRRLGEILDYVKEKSPFYAQRLANHDVSQVTPSPSGSRPNWPEPSGPWPHPNV